MSHDLTHTIPWFSSHHFFKERTAAFGIALPLDTEVVTLYGCGVVACVEYWEGRERGGGEGRGRGGVISTHHSGTGTYMLMEFSLYQMTS